MSTQAITPYENSGVPVLASQPPLPAEPSVDWYKIALANFNYAERYKSANCEKRYRVSDDLYLAATRVAFWEGTKVRRSSMKVFLALQQIEALLPHVVGALFNDDLPFGGRPFPGTTPEAARAVQELIRWQLLWLDPEVGPVPFSSMRELFREGYKSDLIYGNQIVEIGWLNAQRKRTRYERQLVPERQILNHPMVGPVAVPTGEFRWQVRQSEDTEVISKPIAQHVDVRDFFWDPTCASSIVNKGGRYCARRQFPTVAEMAAWRGTPGFEIPDTKTVMDLAKRRSSRPADASKQYTETSRGNSYSPSLEYNDNPQLQRIEVIRYFQKDQIVWISPNGPKADSSETQNDNLVLYSAPNEYEMLPFLTSAYTDVPGRWHGLSICDLVEADQKLAMTILDARIDELNLLIHPPIIRRKGTMVSSTQKRMRPGAEWEVDGKPGEEVMRMEMGNVTQQAFLEVDALDRRAQKTTGVTDSAVVGTATTGGNSALRSATGVQAVTGAATTRIQYQVENKQDHILLPLVYAFHWLNKRFLNPEETTQILGSDYAQLIISNADVMNADVMFEWQAGSKMRSKQALQSGALQTILEATMNSALVSQLAQQGKRPNWTEIAAMICVATNQPPKSLFVDMTPQEMQAWQQQQQSNANAVRMQMQEARLEAQGEHQEAADETKMLIMLLQKIMTPDVAHRLLGMKPAALIQAESQPKDKAQ